jgi:hypothetical protein
MSSRYWGALFSAIALALVAFGLGAMVVSMAQAPMNAGEPLVRCYPSTSQACSQWRATVATERAADAATSGAKIAAVGTAATFGSLILVVIALRQTRRAYALADATAKRQLRAYICTERAALILTQDDLGARVVLKNFGQTPALNVRSWIHIWIANFPLDMDLPEAPPDLRKASAVIAPGFHSEFVHTRGLHLDAHDRAHVESGNAGIYVYGETTYDDIFGQSHRTKFRLVGYGKASLARRKLMPDESGNTVD